MGRRLAGFVHVDGRVYGPDDEVPAGVAKKITHPRAWADGDQPDSGPGDSEEPEPSGRRPPRRG